MGEQNEYFTDWNETYESFDQMNLHENLLRGIYAYGAFLCSSLLLCSCFAVCLLLAMRAGGWCMHRAARQPAGGTHALEERSIGGASQLGVLGQPGPRSGSLDASSRRWRSSWIGFERTAVEHTRLHSQEEEEDRFAWRPPPTAAAAAAPALAPPAGFEKPSAIQQKGIVPFGKGLDVIQQAQSGTGKTATFCAGVLQVRGLGLGLAAGGGGVGAARLGWLHPLSCCCVCSTSVLHICVTPALVSDPSVPPPTPTTTEPGLLSGGVPGPGAGAYPRAGAADREGARESRLLLGC